MILISSAPIIHRVYAFIHIYDKQIIDIYVTAHNEMQYNVDHFIDKCTFFSYIIL